MATLDSEWAAIAKALWNIYGEELPEPPQVMMQRVLTYLNVSASNRPIVR